jgi:hypothetical protein
MSEVELYATHVSQENRRDSVATRGKLKRRYVPGQVVLTGTAEAPQAVAQARRILSGCTDTGLPDAIFVSILGPALRVALRVCFDFQPSRFRVMRSMAKRTIVSLESVRRSCSRSSRRHPPNHP